MTATGMAATSLAGCSALRFPQMTRPRALGRIRIHVQVDVIHAPALAQVTFAGVPWHIANLDAVHLRHLEAAPLAAWRHPPVGYAGELVAEQHLLSLGEAHHVRAHFPPPVPIGENELL